MSLHLGKIHYWLFNKILWFENLEDSIVKAATETELEISVAKNQIEDRYGKKLENKNLEEIIDLNNIHGWLQNRIYSSEGRMAAWVHHVLKNDVNAISNLKGVFKKQALLAAEEVKKEKKCETASDIYDCMNNYILDGMPCDRVNVISVSQKDIVEWERRVDIHKDVWKKEDVDTDIFYDLRDSWIEVFVETLNADFKYMKETNQKFKIMKR